MNITKRTLKTAKKELAERCVNKACHDSKLKGLLSPTFRYFLIKWISAAIDAAYSNGFVEGQEANKLERL